MKKALLITCFILASGMMLMAGNGNGNGSGTACNCSGNDKTDIYQAGAPEWVSATQLKCTGETGTCWDLKYNGGWVLTIYTQPPMILNGNSTTNPNEPQVVESGSNYKVYSIDPTVWSVKR
jgi:hypothetical protein